MNLLSNPIYYFSPIFISAITIVLWILVLKSTKRTLSKDLFLAFLSSAVWWSINTFLMRTSPNLEQALIWDKIGVLVFHLSFILFYHFSLAYTGNLKNKSILIGGYVTLALAIILIPSNLIISGMRIESYGYAPNTATTGLLLGLVDIFLIFAAGYNLIRRYRIITSSQEKNRLLYLAIALVFPLIGGFVDGFSNLPPVFIWTDLFFCVLCSVVIIRFHLLDIRVVIKKSLSYLLISIIIAIPFIAIILLINQFFINTSNEWWISIITVLVIAVALRPLYSWAQHFIDRLFYRDRYDYLLALENFNRESQNIDNLEDLGLTICKLVRGALRSSTV